MFQFRRFPPYTYGFSARYPDMTPGGLLHSEICGSMPTYGSPQLIAVCRVLLRLPVPRHSPCALVRLTMCFLVRFGNCRFYNIHCSWRFLASSSSSLVLLRIFIQFSMCSNCVTARSLAEKPARSTPYASFAPPSRELLQTVPHVPVCRFHKGKGRAVTSRLSLALHSSSHTLPKWLI